eukprot:SM000016S01813  [mRNA]  locus=s16:50562:51105:+ [translate_table: standard]
MHRRHPATADAAAGGGGGGGGDYARLSKWPNPPDRANPDPVALAEQWRYATRLYARFYARAWGAAVLGASACFALGYYLKGGNPVTAAARRASSDGPLGRGGGG